MKTFDDYSDAATYAQKQADSTGFDFGIEITPDGRNTVRLLPQKKNRCGFELRCEVRSATDISKCRPGHGPNA